MFMKRIGYKISLSTACYMSTRPSVWEILTNCMVNNVIIQRGMLPPYNDCTC